MATSVVVVVVVVHLIGMPSLSLVVMSGL